ncbi:TPA: hypothetical protein ROW14_002436 [Yersinia enterocolitica]|uniref:DUF5677 domain-containing protein n=1 Tax=Yersinia intermedia TaxID=631 RepID=UPI0005E11A81|nr:DUF5677 domain-containing protein [Yersinia intermedia]CQJ57986.1 Uncharacterised protein [Yersinia intermedia]HDX9050088.1 hypothetical protein [Yersinia enterocolitica]
MTILKEALKFSHENIASIQFNKKSIKETTSMCALLSLIELANSIHLLLQEKCFTGPYSIYRTFFECYIDLINIHNHPYYIDIIELEYYEREVERYEVAKKGNKYLVGLKETNTFMEKNKLYKQKIKELASIVPEEKRKMSVRAKFILAGAKSEYDSVYATLCEESHCGLASFINRHIEKDEKNGSIKIVMYNKNKIIDFDYYVDNLALYIINAGILVCKILNTPQISIYESQYERIKAMVK